MLTPDDIQKKIFSLGRKLENNEIGVFVKEVQINYQLVYDKVLEQEKQIKGMEKKLKYYRDVEANLQDALVHAERVSDQKIKESQREAEKIEVAAHKKAEDIIADAKSELVYLKSIIKEFEQVYDNYQDKYKDFVQGQLKFISDSKDFMEKEKIHVKKFVSNIDVEDYSQGSLKNDNKQKQISDDTNNIADDTYSQENDNRQMEDIVEENDEPDNFTEQEIKDENFNDENEESENFNQELEFEDNDEETSDVADLENKEQDYSNDSLDNIQVSAEKSNTFTFGKVMNEQEMPIDNQTEVEMDAQSLGENIDEDVEEEMMEGSSSIEDMFTLPEIDMDSLDFSSLNFSSTPQSGGVDFNSTLNSTPQVNDQEDMPVQDETYSYGQNYNDNSNYGYEKQNNYGVDSMNDVENVNESANQNVTNMESDNDMEERVPDLSQNANVELKFANDSFFGKKKKPDNKERVLQGMNLGGTKSDEKARIRQLENSYAQELLKANKQVARPTESDMSESDNQSSRNYGPTNYNSENKGFGSKPLNQGGQEQQRRSLFSMPGDK